MKDEMLEESLKQILKEEQEVPHYLTALAHPRKKTMDLDGYVKWLFVLSCVLFILEEMLLCQLYFIRLEIFIIVSMLFVTTNLVIPVILYLFKADITHFIRNQRRFFE